MKFFTDEKYRKEKALDPAISGRESRKIREESSIFCISW